MNILANNCDHHREFSEQSFRIHVLGGIHSGAGRELFSLLELLLPVRFYFDEQHGNESVGKIFILEDMQSQNEVAQSEGIQTLCVPLGNNLGVNNQAAQIEVEFADNPEVPNPFRRRVVRTTAVRERPFLVLHGSEEVLASSSVGPIWSIYKDNGGMKHFRSCFPFPGITASEGFIDIFSGTRFLEMLPLIHFLRQVGGTRIYRSPPLRAAFIIDDPNLHWTKYGFVDYQEIVSHAQRWNYHVSFATIPLDMWFTHKPTAKLFQRNSSWISLSIHGNNHIRKELARSYSSSERKALLQQAIKRVERLERENNLSVCRVMVPPHGACSDETLRVLEECGFESACISAGSLRSHNSDKPWVKTLGYFPSEIINGCPVIPRIGLSGNVENSLLVAAYLGQPMIVRAHQQDLKDGVWVIDEIAKFINGIGNAFWSSMTNLSRLNYLWRISGKDYHIKPLGKKMSLFLPRGEVEPVFERYAEIVHNDFQTIIGNAPLYDIDGVRLFLSETTSCKTIGQFEVSPRCERTEPVPNPLAIRPIIRRILTEARDRFIHRLI